MQQSTDTECHPKPKDNQPNKNIQFNLSERTKDLRTEFEIKQTVGRCVLTLDTGSEVSIIKITSLKPNTICTREKILLVGLENTIRIKTLGQTHLDIIKDDTQFTYKFHITKKNIGISTDGIIGLDFLREFFGNICLRTNVLSLAVYHKPKNPKLLTVKEILTECIQNTPTKPSSINKINEIFTTSDEEQIIAPFTRTTLKINLPPDTEGDLVCLRSEISPGVLIGDSIVNNKSPRVAVLNTNNTSVKIKPDKLKLKFNRITEYTILGITKGNTNIQERKNSILHT